MRIPEMSDRHLPLNERLGRRGYTTRPAQFDNGQKCIIDRGAVLFVGDAIAVSDWLNGIEELVERSRIQRVRDALEATSDDLPDGAWMACLCALTGLDAGEVSSALEHIARSEQTSEQRSEQ